MTNTPNNIDETTNHDLPGEVFPCGHYQERWWDWNPAVFGPDSEEPVFGDEDWRDPNVWNDENDAPDFDEESMGADGDFYDCEDDSWSDSDSLASCGWAVSYTHLTLPTIYSV